MSEIELRPDCVPSSLTELAPDGVPSIGPAPRLESERVVLAAPLSFQGSAIRIWRGVAEGRNGWMGALSVLAIVFAWTGVLAWYTVFGLLLVPYRLMRRTQRTGKRNALRHQELLSAMYRENK
jgi:hypothetical protein